MVENFTDTEVSPRIIIAIFWGFKAKLLDIFITFEVGIEGLDESIHGDLLFIEDKVLHISDGVDDISLTNCNDTAASIVLAPPGWL